MSRITYHTFEGYSVRERKTPQREGKMWCEECFRNVSVLKADQLRKQFSSSN